MRDDLRIFGETATPLSQHVTDLVIVRDLPRNGEGREQVQPEDRGLRRRLKI